MRQKLQNSKSYDESPEFLPALGLFVTPHAQHERGKVIGCGVHIYICLWTKKNLNRTLEIDSPFQTFAVGLLVEFID